MFDGVIGVSPRDTVSYGDRGREARDAATGARSFSETPPDTAREPEIFQTDRICPDCGAHAVRGMITDEATTYSCCECGSIVEMVEARKE